MKQKTILFFTFLFIVFFLTSTIPVITQEEQIDQPSNTQEKLKDEEATIEEPSASALTSVTVTRPDEASVVGAGSPYEIQWTWVGTTTFVEISLYRWGQYCMSIELLEANDGSYTWNVPGGLDNTEFYQIRVKDSSGPVQDLSTPYFSTINGEDLTVTDPISSDQWDQGTTHYITWTNGLCITDVTIELYKNGVYQFKIADDTSGSGGTYSWSIPTDLESDDRYQIKIVDQLDFNEYDFSPNFQIGEVSSDDDDDDSTSTPIQYIPLGNYYLIIIFISIISLIYVQKNKRAPSN